MTDLVSVIMPAFNAARYIAEAVESVRQQDWPHWELMVVDNNSSDGTIGIVRQFNDARIKILSESRQGTSHARNKALENIRGNYFCFLDADDRMPECSLSSRLNLFRSRSNIEFVDGQVWFMNKTMSATRKCFVPNFRGNPFPELVSLSTSCYCGITWMIKKIPGKIYRFESAMTHAEDLAFYLSLCAQGEYDFVENCTYRVRRGHRSAITDTAGIESGYEKIYSLISALENLPAGHNEFLAKKIRSIVCKTYLRNAQPWNALRSWKKFTALLSIQHGASEQEK